MKYILLAVSALIASLIITYFVDDKARNEKIISRFIKLKSLGYIPLSNNQRNLMIENNPKANMMKYIRDVRDNILSSTNKKVISIISCDPKEGKSWVSNNIAVSFARINKKVILIDADLGKKSNKSEIFYTEHGEGLSDFLRDIEIDNRLENLYKSKKYIKQTQIPNLHILQSGTVVLNTLDLIKSKKMKELLNILKEMYDYILIDGTSFFESKDCIQLAKIVDTNILVVENKKTSCKDLKFVIEELTELNCNILGFILNKTNIKKGKYYAKKNKLKYGVYLETTEENELQKDVSLDDIIDPLAEKLKENSLKKFDVLHQELNKNITFEDFINDIEVNFNMKFNNIEKENKNNLSTIFSKLEEIKKNMSDELNIYNYQRNKDKDNYEKFSEYIFKYLNDLETEIRDFKSIQEEKQNELMCQIIEQIQKKGYDKKIEGIKNQLEEMNYEKQIEQLKTQINSLDYSEQIDELKKQIENISEKKTDENKKSNIINLKNLFAENRKKETRVFSIDEPIKFEELERLATEVIDFDEIDKTTTKVYNIY